MIPNIRNFTKDELLYWLRNEAGVNDAKWFGQNLKVGNLELQQVPEEYVDYLWFLKNSNIRKYLNIGVGKGASFMLETYIQPNLELAVAVDNCSYYHMEQTISIIEKVAWLQENIECTVEFYDSDSVSWLKSNSHLKFDAIFIDGDHSYQGLKNDYDNALPLLNNGGYIIFHDVNSKACPGVKQIWNETKNSSSIEFIKSETCGIGIIKK